MKLYAYCVTAPLDGLPVAVNGVAGAQVRLLNVENFSLLVSDCAAEVVEVNRENALAHAAVVQSVLDVTTPLPFRFGTVVTEKQLENYLRTHREALESKLELVRGCVEMSVKIIGGRDSTEMAVPGNSAQEKPGTAFLSEKRREILGGEARAAEAKRVAEWLMGQIGELVTNAQTNLNPTERMILAAAHLVERSRVEQYRTKLADARHERPDLHFLVSGPWPPYSFANIDLEFKTHFGVS